MEDSKTDFFVYELVDKMEYNTQYLSTFLNSPSPLKKKSEVGR